MRILYLASWYPYPPDNGSRQRTFHLVRGLAGNHRVTLVAFYDAEQTPNPTRDAEGLCERIIALPRREYRSRRWSAVAGFLSDKPRYLADTHDPTVMERIRQESGNDYDLVIASQLGMAVYAAELPHPLKIFDEVEVGLFADLSQGSNPVGRMRNKLMWLKFERYVRSLVPKFSAVTVVSPAERQRLLGLGVRAKRIFLVPNGVEPVDTVSDDSYEPYTCIYNGAVTYSANYDAMCYFVCEILPKIRSAEPRVRLRITGRATQVAQNALAEDNVVSFTGYVDDVRALVRASAVCVVPLRQGGGTRLKILEAMAVGTPVVATGKGSEGLNVRDGVHLLIADNPEDFASATLQLLRDTDLRKNLTRNALDLVRTEYDWNIIGAQFDELLTSVSTAR